MWVFFMLVMSAWGQMDPRAWMEQRPESAFLKDSRTGQDARFCADWNPDFGFVGGLCCGKADRKVRRQGIRCNPARSKENFCDEMTPEQVAWIRGESAGIRPVSRAYCGYNDGFLAWGKPIVSTPSNRLVLRNVHRCVHFGTDEMASFLDTLGAAAWSDHRTQLVVGDVSAPRGGCLSGHGGRRGHFSHTSGRDVDLGFLVRGDRRGDEAFTKAFDPELNLWFVKKMFSNPSVCVRVIFLDHRLIAKLALQAERSADPTWKVLAPHVRHVRGHRNHFHVRIGDGPGPMGCDVSSEPELASADISLANVPRSRQ